LEKERPLDAVADTSIYFIPLNEGREKMNPFPAYKICDMPAFLSVNSGVEEGPKDIVRFMEDSAIFLDDPDWD
jgi:hypothetical protein